MRRVAMLMAAGVITASCGGTGPTTGGSATSPIPSASGTESQRPPNTITVANNSFQPSRLEVKAGTMVTWSNIGSNPHDVVSLEKLFNSHPSCSGSSGTGCLKIGETFRYTFARAGTYKYYCSIHAVCDQKGCGGMFGIVDVA